LGVIGDRSLLRRTGADLGDNHVGRRGVDRGKGSGTPIIVTIQFAGRQRDNVPKAVNDEGTMAAGMWRVRRRQK
jgi:hypothetical protein